MKAAISGQAGVAVLIDGERLASMHAGEAGALVSRRPDEIRLLLGDASDLDFVEEGDLPDIQIRLELATSRYDALHLALILLDGTLAPETRRTAAEELECLLAEPAVALFPERVFCAHPFPQETDLVGAYASCSEATPRTKVFLECFQAWQPIIAKVHHAWEQIPESLFVSKGRDDSLALAVREGAFEAIVKAILFDHFNSDLLHESVVLSDSKFSGLAVVFDTWIAILIDKIVEEENVARAPLDSYRNEPARPLPIHSSMDVSNTTGTDIDYKVTGSGGTRGPGGWNRLGRHSRCRHEVDDDGPWDVKFKVLNGSSSPQILGARCSDPEGEVELLERGGQYSVDIKIRRH